jgi:hypothetical protein
MNKQLNFNDINLLYNLVHLNAFRNFERDIHEASIVTCNHTTQIWTQVWVVIGEHIPKEIFNK